MRTAEERIAVLHKRTAELKRERDKKLTLCWGSISLMMFVSLIGLNMQMIRGPHTLMDEQFTGSSLISDSAGGQILIAVIAFMAGVVITTLIRW